MTDPATPTPTPAPDFVAAAAVPPVTPAAEPAAPNPDAPAPGQTELGKPEPKAEPTVPFDAAKLTLPEGMKTDDPLFTSFSGLLADDKISPQERGQKLLDLYKDGIKATGEANMRAWTDTKENWVKEIKADPAIGGAKFAEVKTTIAKAIDTLGPEGASAFRQALDITGAGDNPAIWRGLHAMALKLTEGGHVGGNPPSKGNAFEPKSFFENSKMS